MQNQNVKFGVNKLFILIVYGFISLVVLNCDKDNHNYSTDCLNPKSINLVQINKVENLNSLNNNISNSTDSIFMEIRSVFRDANNSYFIIKIFNSSAMHYYFPVDFDFSYQFYDRYKKSDTLYYSSFYTKFYSQSNKQIVGFTSFYDWDSKKRRQIIDSLEFKDSTYKIKYGSHPNQESFERRFWGIKYNQVKKNGFFLKPNEEKELTIRSHFKEDPRAYASSDITYFSSREIGEIAFAQLILNLDSTQVKRDLLLPKDIDSLNVNKIKIFNGKIFSDKVSIKW